MDVLGEYLYRDRRGNNLLLVKKCRDGAGKKQYPQYHWDGRQWTKGKPRGPKIPYRLPELINTPLTTTVYICEGEKDADNLAKIGLVATTASEGAGAKWAAELTEYFRDRRVVVLPDADTIGRKHAQKVAHALDRIVKSLKVVDLHPGRSDGSDVSNWLESDSAGVKLIKAVNDVPIWEPGEVSAGATTADEAIIAELAELFRLDYAKRRKSEAEKIGITVSRVRQDRRRGTRQQAEPQLLTSVAR